MSADTLPRLLWRNAAEMAGAPAFRLRHHGIWQITSWTEFAKLVGDFMMGLVANGVSRGVRVAVIGENRPRLYAATLAAQALGGIGVPLHPDLEPGQIGLVLRAAGAAVLVAQNRDMLASVREVMPSACLAVCESQVGPDAPGVLAYDAVVAAGRRFGEGHPHAVAAAIEAGRADDPALLLHTSESASPGMVLSHRRLLAAAAGIVAAEDVRPGDNAFCYLPMSGMGDTVYSLALGLLVGLVLNCPETPHTLLRDLREIGPHLLLAPPPLWVAMARNIDERAASATPMKRRVFHLFQHISMAIEYRRESGATVPLAARTADWLGDFVVNRAVRDQLGLTRLRWAHVGAEALDPEVRRRFRALGVNLRRDETELTGLVRLPPEVPANA